MGCAGSRRRLRGDHELARALRSSPPQPGRRRRMQRTVLPRWISFLGALLLAFVSNPVSANSVPAKEARWFAVHVTAYNAHVAQTDSDPWVAAWGDRLR